MPLTMRGKETQAWGGTPLNWCRIIILVMLWGRGNEMQSGKFHTVAEYEFMPMICYTYGRDRLSI